MKKGVLLLLSLLLGYGHAQAHGAPLGEQLNPGKALDAINMTMVHDVVSPPVAGRYYAYSMLGAYTIVATHNKTLPALQRLVQAYPTLRLDTIKSKYDYQIAAYYSILETARQMLPSGENLAGEEEDFVRALEKQGVKPAMLAQSIRVGKLAAVAVVNFAKTDRYTRLSALKRYAPLKDDGAWYPTPPAYIEAVEPNWKVIRPMVIDSSTQFKPAPLVPFSKDTTSAFHKQVVAVYDVSKHLTDDQRTIALFWDCNPFAISTSGHMSIGFKKISPGGHWMNIAALVARQQKVGFDKTVAVMTLEGITLMDAFISCWEAKYATNRIRPETYINRYMDVQWQPVLQTPPFPEYTSGHAVISQASAELLTYLLGDNISYLDNTEIPFGSGERAFTSFRQAANEASISRFYGGIHYMESINNGNAQGQKIGRYMVAKLQKASVKPVTK